MALAPLVGTPTSGGGNNLDGVDLWILNLAGKNDVELAIGNVHVDRLDISAPRAAGLHPHVKILEFTTFDIEGKNALAGAFDAVVCFGEVELDHILAVGQRVRKRIH
jgi:hypothetical protein